MNLLADEGVDKPIVDILRSNGFDVVYILETNQGADDEFVLATANTHKRVLLTQDKDFGDLVYRLKNAHYGVVLIQLEGYKPHLKAATVLNMLITHKDELVNSFTVIQTNAIRIRK
jgi:predicted nuclease of predicted toxin-antitoxin system